MSKLYVKLRDAGTIFFDSSQDVSVTGVLPVEVKRTAKVEQFIRNGNLIEVEEAEAEKLIAKDSKDIAAIKKANANSESQVVKELKTQLAKATQDLAASQSENVKLSEQVAANEGLQDSLVELQAQWDKAQPYIKGLQTQIKNLREGKKDEGDVPDPFAAEEAKK